MRGCETCKNAVELIGAFSGTHYLECKFEQEFAKTATLEELTWACEHPDALCKYCKGTPENGGITYDD